MVIAPIDARSRRGPPTHIWGDPPAGMFHSDQTEPRPKPGSTYSAEVTSSTRPTASFDAEAYLSVRHARRLSHPSVRRSTGGLWGDSVAVASASRNG
jgi:hypothetical protein